MNMSMLEHPAISMALATGYPSPPKDPVCFCDRCGREINEGDVYYDDHEEFICESCMNRHRRVAGED